MFTKKNSQFQDKYSVINQMHDSEVHYTSIKPIQV